MKIVIRVRNVKNDQVDAFSPQEILGYTAIVIGVVGGLAQMKQTGGSRDLSSFSWIYLTCAANSRGFVFNPRYNVEKYFDLVNES